MHVWYIPSTDIAIINIVTSKIYIAIEQTAGKHSENGLKWRYLVLAWMAGPASIAATTYTVL